ncbi:MAG: hypothetical protein ACYDCO_02190 [Armatimonadota bacterium]
MAEHDATQPRKRSRIRTILLTLTAVIGLIVAGLAIVGAQYHGPRTLDAVTKAMPGVPLFPFAGMAPSNGTAQRLLAVPLLLARLRGVRKAEAVVLQVPAEREFVLDWYRRATPYQGWTRLQEAPSSSGTRLVFLRNRELLQVVIGHTVNGINTPIQLIYLDGVSDAQITRLQARGRVGVQ